MSTGARLGFFEQSATANAVHRVASKTTDLTLFVGLGASLASGLPAWSGFARAVVEDLAGFAGADSEEAAEAIIQSEDLLTSMEIARASWPDRQFESAMVKALYGRPPLAPERATSHEAIAELAVTWATTNPKSQVTILTTNYDLLIERALHRLSPSLIEPGKLFGSCETIERGEESPHGLWEFSLGCSYGGVVATPAGSDEWMRPSGSTKGSKIRVRVVHLHGVLTPEHVEGHSIATASDYYEDSKSHKAARRALSTALERSTCIFLGTSLNDPLVLSHLHSIRSTRRKPPDSLYEELDNSGSDGLQPPYEPHWRVPREPLAAVVFSRESYPWAVDKDLSDDTKRSLEDEYSAMWRQLRLSVLWSDFYSQPYQFLREVSYVRRRLSEKNYFEKDWPLKKRPPENRIENGRRKVRRHSYGARVDMWARAFLTEFKLPSRHTYEPVDPTVEQFLAQQRRVREFLLRYRDRTLQHALNVQDPISSDEEWKLDLWVRSPEKHALLRVASTQYEFLEEPTTAVPYPIAWQSDLPAVRAFVNGQMSEEDDGIGRWRYCLAIPVRQTPEVPSLDIDSARRSRQRWGDFPVGALVLASTMTRPESMLSRRSLAKRNEVRTLLQVAGNEIVSFGPEDG